MSDILVRNLAPETVANLKERARRNNRSLQAEVREILEREAFRELRREDIESFLKVADDIRQRAGPQTSDSVDLIRQDRDDSGR